MLILHFLYSSFGTPLKEKYSIKMDQHVADLEDIEGDVSVNFKGYFPPPPATPGHLTKIFPGGGGIDLTRVGHLT